MSNGDSTSDNNNMSNKRVAQETALDTSAAIMESEQPLKKSIPLSPTKTVFDDDDDTATASTISAPQYDFLQRQARRVARWPHTYLWTALLGAVGLSVAGMLLGDFHVVFDNLGWPSRGTLISDRQSQLMLVKKNRYDLASKNNSAAWRDLTTTVQCGWQQGCRPTSVTDDGGGSVAVTVSDTNETFTNTSEDGMSNITTLTTAEEEEEEQDNDDAIFSGPISPTSLTELWSHCDVEMYAKPDFIVKHKLWPVWQVKDSNASALDPDLLQTICEAEEQTQAVLHENGLCHGCDNQQCLPPFSVVLYARFTVRDGFGMNCSQLADAWAPFQAETEEEWKQCVAHLRSAKDVNELVEDRGPCPTVFSPVLVDDLFDQTGRVSYTSSIFVTKGEDLEEIYELRDGLGRGDSDNIEVAYDSQLMKFMELYAVNTGPQNLFWCAGSVIVTTTAMMIHTRSPFLTLIGIIQIALSFPLAYSIYRFLGGITFFPFLNLVGVFVAFALGADHVFVAVDKWKNERLDHPHATTEDVAGNALPGAGRAMVLTTATTAIAFFGSGICPVLPVKLFGIFCGLLISVDYILDCLVMFPCLCIYDSYRHQRNYFMDLHCSKRSTTEEGLAVPPAIEKAKPVGEEKDEETDDMDLAKDKRETAVTVIDQDNNCCELGDPQNVPLIRRILLGYYNCIHKCRWILFVLSLAAILVCGYIASQLRPPDSSFDVQVLVGSVEYEKARSWRPELLYSALLSNFGEEGNVIWGVKPADTGDKLDPYTWTELVLDDSFEPSSKAAQIYLRDYCARFFEQEFAERVQEGIDPGCSITDFDDWLQQQSSLPEDVQSETYLENCNGATAIPLEEDTFHPCLSSWAQEEEISNILSLDGVVKIIFIGFKSRIRFDNEDAIVGKEWHLVEAWMDEDRKHAPVGVERSFFSQLDYLFWDTNNAVSQTARWSGAIAIAVAALVILFSSRSLSVTIFSAISVAYVLVSVTAMMVLAGWTLGFLESICFTILIGLSADFVLHFSHAYTELPGDTDRGTRTKHALIHLGPSILAAGITTVAGAAMMLFSVIYFWRLFSLVLLFTIIQATIGCFVVFVVLVDCIGPSNPTYLFDIVASNCAACVGMAASKCALFWQQLQPENVAVAPRMSQVSTAESDYRNSELFNESQSVVTTIWV